MDDEVKVQGAEGIVATPAQQKVALDTKTYYDDPLSVRLAAYQPEKNKETIATSFSQNKDWRDFLADPVRNIKPDLPDDYRTFRQLEKMYQMPEYASIVDMYGSDMAVGGQMLSDYVDWDKVSWWDKQLIGIGAARRGMQIGELRTKIANMEHDGADQAQIDMAKTQLADLEKYAADNTRPYDSDAANAFASFGVSAARVIPEMAITSTLLGLALPSGGATAGAAVSGATRVAMTLGNALSKGSRAANIIRGLKAARTVGKASKAVSMGTELTTAGVRGFAEARVVYNDTYRVTMGDLYKRIKDENPELSDEQAYDLADTSASLQAAMEAAPALIGLGARAAITTELDVAVKSILNKVPKDAIRRAAFIQAFQRNTNKEIAKRVAAGWTKDTIADTLTEVAQTAAENATMEIADQNGGADRVLSDSLSRLSGFLLNPLDERYDDELNTLLSTLPAAMVFGGVAPSIAMAGRAMSKNSVGSKISDVFHNSRFGAQMRGYTQDMKKKGVAPEAIKEMIRGMASNGDAPKSVYFDRAAVQELADKDPEFRRAMDRLGVLKQLQESEGNGGVVEVDFADYNELVNGEESGALYQKVKDMVSFKLDSMTMTQLNEWIKSTEIQNKKEIQRAIANEKSVYNRALTEYFSDQSFDAMTEDQRKANATLLQLVANRAVQSMANPMTAEEWFEKNVLLTKGEPSGAATLQKVAYDTPYTSNGNSFMLTQGMGGETQVLHLTDNEGNVLSSIEIGKDNIVRETFTAEGHRRQGFGTKLVQEAERLFGKLGVTTASKEAKQFWDKLGYTKSVKGVKYKQTDTSLKQKTEGQKIAGWFDVVDGKYVIGLTDNWNATTFTHEVFHLYSRVLQDNYNSGVMSSYWKAQTEKLFKTVDAKPNKKGQYKLTRNQEELLAERFTTYLLDNEIQNPELNSIFALLRDAFHKTYTQFNMTRHEPDKKTKEAFSVIFGAQDVAIAEQQALGLVEIEKPEGVSQEAYDHYMSFILEARAKASHDMIKKYYRIEKFKQSKEYAKAYDEAYTRYLHEVEQESVFQVKALAKQLDTQDVKAILTAYNSTHGEALITEDEVVSALNNTEEATTVAEARTAEAMNNFVKEKFKMQEGQTLVSKEVRNVSMAKAFLMEALMREGKDWADFETEYTRLLDVVENQIQKMPLSKLTNSRRWSQLESVHAQQYQMYASLGDNAKAAAARRAQAQVVLIQNTMFEMNNRVDRFLTKFPKKLRTAQPANQNTMTAESWDLLQSLMEQYGFKISDRRRSGLPFNIKLENWLKNIEESEYCPISNLRYFMPETVKGHQGSFGSMTVRQFEVLEHMATAINSVASREYNLITEDEKVKYDTLVALTAERFKEKGLKPFEKDDGWWRKHFGILSNIVNPEPIMKALFPEEVQQKLVRPLFSAASRAETDFNKWDAKWNEMIKKVNLSNTKKLYSTGHELSYNNVANLLLAMGNEHAYQNWRLFLKMDEAQAEAVVTEALAEQPQLAEFANAYWAMMAETTELMNDSYRKRYNKLFVKKEPRAFKIGNHEFTGGYVSEAKLVSELREDAGWESILMGELSSEKLLNDTPDGQDLQSIVDNTRGRLRLFARWGHVAPAFNNFVRFVQREDVGAVIGSRAQNYIKGWLRDYHTPAGDSAGLMHALMAATTTTVLGIRLPQALLQLSGLIPAMGILGRGGIRYMVSALGRSLMKGGAHQVEYARSLPSDYMKARYADPTKTLFGVSKAEAHISQTVDKFQKFAMAGISYIDAVVANATWNASYRMARDNGLTHQEAIESADQNVRLSQTDSLTISRSRAMKSDWARIITPFSTYMMGMQSVVRGRIAEKEFYGAFGFALSYIVGSTIFEAALKEIPMPWEDEDEKDYVERILQRWYNDAISTAGSTLYPIAGLGSDAAKSFAWATEKILYPDEQTVIDMWGGGSLAALSYAKQYPDAMRYGLVGIFNGDEDAQRKAIANFVGWFSAGGKRMVKDMLED